MKILQCPKCHNLIAIPHDTSHGFCESHNPRSLLTVEKHCAGTLTKRQVNRAEKISEVGGITFSEALIWLLEMKQL